VTHKGFPIPQNVVDAMYEICRLQDGSEMNYNQKEDFMRYIRGKDENNDYFCYIWNHYFNDLKEKL
jgi:hypothetical protein